MSGLWMVARAELRARWRAWLVLAVLLGIAAGAVMTAAAGARRSSSAFDRWLAASNTHDVEVQIVEEAPEDTLERVAELPQVASAGRFAFVPAQAAGSSPFFSWNVTAATMIDDTVSTAFDIPRIVAGRRMNLDDPHEAMVSPVFARERGVGVGDTFTFETPTFPELFALFDGNPVAASGPRVTVTIAGVWSLAHDVGFTLENRGLLYLSPAFHRTYEGRAAMFEAMWVRLRNGPSDVPAFTAAAREIAGDPNALGFATQDTIKAKVQSSLDVLGVAAWLFAGLLALGALVVIGQSLARTLALSAVEHPTLHAVGFTRGQRVAVSLVPATGVAVGAAVIGAGIAIVASPLVPFGLARELDPSVGLFVDMPVILIGFGAVLALVVGRAALAAVTVVHESTSGGEQVAARASVLADATARAGLSASAVAGVRFAVERGRGRTAVPVRSALIGAAAGVLAVTAAVSFGRSFDHALAEPSVYGWTWDLVGFGGEDPELLARYERALLDDNEIAGVTRVQIRTVELDGEDIGVVGVRPLRGSVSLPVLRGSLPADENEIALGAAVQRRLDVRIGDTVTLAGTAEACGGAAGCPIDMRVVGVAMVFGEEQELGEGATVTDAGLARLRGTSGFIDFLIRLAPDADRGTVKDRLQAILGHQEPIEPRLPVELQNLSRVRGMPYLLAGLLGALALGAIAHALITSVRRRRRDLAILKTTGFVRRQIAGAVAWQASTLALLALAVGMPLGIVLGRWGWLLTADRLSILRAAVTPLASLGIGVIGLVLVANLVSALPARAAARTRPAVVLRSE